MPLVRRRLTGSMRPRGPSVAARLGAIGAALAVSVLAPALPLTGSVPATVTRDPALPRLSAGGVTLHGALLGEATDPVVVAIHDGPGGDHRALLALAALTEAPTDTERAAATALDIAPGERTYRVLFYDQRGGGLSPRVGRDVPSLDEALDELGAVIDGAVGDGEVRLVGQGWGAMLATVYLGRFPNRVAGAVLVEPLFLDAAAGDRYRAATRVPPDRDERLGALWRAYRGLAMFGPDGRARADWRAGGRLERAAARRTPPSGCPAAAPTYWRVGAGVAEAVWRALEGADGRFDPERANLTAGAGRYGRPVRLVAGACSPFAAEVRRTQADRFLEAEVLTIPAAGHDVFVDAPDAAVAAVRGHFDALRDAEAIEGEAP